MCGLLFLCFLLDFLLLLAAFSNTCEIYWKRVVLIFQSIVCVFFSTITSLQFTVFPTMCPMALTLPIWNQNVSMDFPPNICFLTNPLQKSNLSFGMPESWRFFLPLKIFANIEEISDIGTWFSHFSSLEILPLVLLLLAPGGRIMLIKIPLWESFSAHIHSGSADKVTSILTKPAFWLRS